MEKMMIRTGGGNSVTSDDLTALKSHVLAGKTAVTKDSGDEIITGTMPNRGAVNVYLNCGQSYTIPEGFHNGNGWVIANALTEQTKGNAAASDIRTGKSLWVNGVLINGTRKQMSGGTFTPKSTDQTFYGAGSILTSNVVLNGDPNFVESNIKKGVTIWNKTGTYEGYSLIPTPQEWNLVASGKVTPGYSLQGMRTNEFWTGGGVDKFVYESGQILVHCSHYFTFRIPQRIDFTNYNYLNTEFAMNSKIGSPVSPSAIKYCITDVSDAATFNDAIKRGTYLFFDTGGSPGGSSVNGIIRSSTVNISSITGSHYVYFNSSRSIDWSVKHNLTGWGIIFRIWLSKDPPFGAAINKVS